MIVARRGARAGNCHLVWLALVGRSPWHRAPRVRVHVEGNSASRKRLWLMKELANQFQLRRPKPLHFAG